MNFLKHILVIASVAIASNWALTSPNGKAPYGVAPISDTASYADSSGIADSSRVSGLADSALHAPPSAYADSSRASGLADSAKRAGWAPLDSGRVRGIVGDTATALRTYVGSASTTGNAATATKLATARTIGISGDVTGTATAFDGTKNITIPTALPTLLTAGSAGGAASVPTLTWDAKGRLTAVGSAAISIPHTQINDWGTYINQPLLTTSSPTFGSANIGTMIGYPTYAWFGCSGLNTGTKYSGFYQTNASDIGIAALSGHGVYLQVAQAQILDILGDGIIAHQPISANSGITGNLTGLADSAKRAGWAPTDSVSVLGITSGAYVRKSGDTMSGALRLSGNYGSGIDFVRNQATYGGVRLWQYGDASTYEGVKFQAIDTSGGSSTLPVWVVADIFSGTFLGQATSADSSRASGLADSAKKAGTAANSLALGGIPAAGYGTLAQDTAISKKVASDTATVLRTGIGSAITTSEAYATARISDSLTANARAWTTLTAAKSSIHDTATALRTYIGSASTTGNAATATKLATARTIAMTGDGTWSTSFDGSANATGKLTLATVNSNVGSFGSGYQVPYITVNAKGQVTAVANYNITIPHSQINDWSTATSSFLTANQSISLTGAVTGVGTTSIATSFANPYLAGINQALTTTSSPTFGAASLGTWAPNSALAWFGAAGQNNNTNGNSGFLQHTSGHTYMCAPSGTDAEIQYTGYGYLRVNSSGVSILQDAPLLSVTPPSTFTGLITANGGISGNLTGHASLDIPLTGSVAVTGSIQTTQGLYAASGMVGMYSMYDNIFTIGNNAHNIQVNNTTGETNFIGLTSVGMQGSLTVSGTFTPAVNLQSSIYTITRADQGKMVVSNNTLNLPSLTVHDAGFWCLVNWHVGGGQAVFGPTTSGTTWILRGQYINVSTSTPFSGIVSWDGYNWYAN